MIQRLRKRLRETLPFCIFGQSSCLFKIHSTNYNNIFYSTFVRKVRPLPAVLRMSLCIILSLYLSESCISEIVSIYVLSILKTIVIIFRVFFCMEKDYAENNSVRKDWSYVKHNQ